MKHILLILILFFSSISTTNEKEEYVYICTGGYSECYHKTELCEGLDKCAREIKKITLDEAKKLGRRPCGYCYKK